jgi:hypothetical protein
MMNTLEFHPYANLFPLMEGKEFDALVTDIKTNGLRDSIMLLDGKILDGRNRYRACLAAGVEPAMHKWREDWPHHGNGGPLGYVLSQNLHRRHLTTDQRAAIAAELVTMEPGDNQHTKADEPLSNDRPSPKLSTAQAAGLMKVSTASTSRAKKRMREDPEAHEKAKAGKLERKKPEPRKAVTIDTGGQPDPIGDAIDRFIVETPGATTFADAARLRGMTATQAGVIISNAARRDPVEAEQAPPRRTSGKCKKQMRICDQLSSSQWFVDTGGEQRGKVLIKLEFVAASSDAADEGTFMLKPTEARELAKALLVYADWLDPARPATQRKRAPEVEVQRVAPISDAGIVDDAPHPDADLRAQLEAMIAKGTTDEVTFANSADVAYPALTKFLEGKTISYHDVRKIAAQIGARP